MGAQASRLRVINKKCAEGARSKCMGRFANRPNVETRHALSLLPSINYYTTGEDAGAPMAKPADIRF